MRRIFLTLCLVSTLLLLAAARFGFESRPRSTALSYHLLTSVAALIFTALVHAAVLTYFMGTSRWMEEVGQAYSLDAKWTSENRQLKHRTIPALVACLLLLVLNIPSGAMTLPRVHLAFALFSMVVNAAVNVLEYRAIRRNGELIAEVVGEVRRIRETRGLPV